MGQFQAISVSFVEFILSVFDATDNKVHEAVDKYHFLDGFNTAGEVQIILKAQ
jgi:hypothetical protein